MTPEQLKQYQEERKNYAKGLLKKKRQERRDEFNIQKKQCTEKAKPLKAEIRKIDRKIEKIGRDHDDYEELQENKEDLEEQLDHIEEEIEDLKTELQEKDEEEKDYLLPSWSDDSDVKELYPGVTKSILKEATIVLYCTDGNSVHLYDYLDEFHPYTREKQTRKKSPKSGGCLVMILSLTLLSIVVGVFISVLW